MGQANISSKIILRGTFGVHRRTKFVPSISWTKSTNEVSIRVWGSSLRNRYSTLVTILRVGQGFSIWWFGLLVHSLQFRSGFLGRKDGLQGGREGLQAMENTARWQGALENSSICMYSRNLQSHWSVSGAGHGDGGERCRAHGDHCESDSRSEPRYCRRKKSGKFNFFLVHSYIIPDPCLNSQLQWLLLGQEAYQEDRRKPWRHYNHGGSIACL